MNYESCKIDINWYQLMINKWWMDNDVLYGESTPIHTHGTSQNYNFSSRRLQSRHARNKSTWPSMDMTQHNIRMTQNCEKVAKCCKYQISRALTRLRSAYGDWDWLQRAATQKDIFLLVRYMLLAAAQGNDTCLANRRLIHDIHISTTTQICLGSFGCFHFQDAVAHSFCYVVFCLALCSTLPHTYSP